MKGVPCRARVGLRTRDHLAEIGTLVVKPRQGDEAACAASRAPQRGSPARFSRNSIVAAGLDGLCKPSGDCTALMHCSGREAHQIASRPALRPSQGRPWARECIKRDTKRGRARRGEKRSFRGGDAGAGGPRHLERLCRCHPWSTSHLRFDVHGRQSGIDPHKNGPMTPFSCSCSEASEQHGVF